MTLRHAGALQSAVFARLATDPALGALVGGAVYDAPPEQAEPAALAHVTLGEERVRPFDTKTSRGARHEFAVTVHSGADGFAAAKAAAAAVCEALVDAPLVIETGRLVSIAFVRAAAERGPAPEKRRVSLLFRAVIDQDA